MCAHRVFRWARVVLIRSCEHEQGVGFGRPKIANDDPAFGARCFDHLAEPYIDAHMMDFVPPSAARAPGILPEHKIAGLELTLLNGHIAAVVRLIRGAAPEVISQIRIDLVY